MMPSSRMRSVYQQLMRHNRTYFQSYSPLSRFQYICRRTVHIATCNFAEEHDRKETDDEHDLDFYGVQNLKDSNYQTHTLDSSNSERFKDVNISKLVPAPEPVGTVRGPTGSVEERLPYGSIRYDKPPTTKSAFTELREKGIEEEKDSIALRRREKMAKKAGKKVRKLMQTADNEDKYSKSKTSNVYSHLGDMYFRKEPQTDNVSNNAEHVKSQSSKNIKLNLGDGEGKNQIEHHVETTHSTMLHRPAEMPDLHTQESNLSYKEDHEGKNQIEHHVESACSTRLHKPAEMPELTRASKPDDREQMGFIDKQYFDEQVIDSQPKNEKQIVDVQDMLTPDSLSYVDEMPLNESDLDKNKYSDGEEMSYIDLQYFDADNLESQSTRPLKEKEFFSESQNKRRFDPSIIDEHFFYHRQKDEKIKGIEERIKHTEDYASTTSAENDLAFIDEQYFGPESVVTENERKTREEENVCNNVEYKHNIRSNSPHNIPGKNKQNITEDLSRSTAKDKPNKAEMRKTSKLPKQIEKQTTKPEKLLASEISDIDKLQSDVEKMQNFKSVKIYSELGNRKLRAKQRKDIDEDEDNAYYVSRKLREEFERKEKTDVYGRANPKVYDSKGFRILTGQTPDFTNVPSIDVIRVLRENILYNGYDVVAISKPYGLPLQGGISKDLCVDQFLGDILPFTTLYSIETIEAESTGVMLFAKTEEMKKILTEKLKEGLICKRFLTITKNIPKLLQGEIDIPIVESMVEGKHRMALRPHRTRELASIIPRRQPGKEAITRYRVLDSKDNSYALVECIPLTSVKHQLRVHLSFALNCPILGDHKYSHVNKFAPMNLHPNMLQRLKIQQSKVRHIALHLHCRSVVIPSFLNGRNLFVSAPLSVHFLANMRDLKLKMPPNC